MNRGLGVIAVIVLIVGAILAYSSMFTVHQREQAIRLQFGKVVDTVIQPGLHFKIPFVQTVVYFDKRVLEYDGRPEEVPTLDQKQLVVDAFGRYRIVDPLKFYQTATNEQGMFNRLQSVVGSNLRSVLGGVSMITILTDKRADLMKKIAKNVADEAKSFGIEVLDVRLKRIDLPEENSQAIYRRMETQRKQEAIAIRASGDRERKQIMAEADKQSRVIIAQSRKKSEILRGEGEGQAQLIYNTAYGQDPAFFDFFVSMRAYKEGLGGSNTRYIGPPDGDFFRYFGKESGKPGTSPQKAEQ